MNQLLDLVLACKYAYYVNSESLMCDSDFDILERQLKFELANEHPYKRLVGWSDEFMTDGVMDKYDQLRSGSFELYIAYTKDEPLATNTVVLADPFRSGPFWVIPCSRPQYI